LLQELKEKKEEENLKRELERSKKNKENDRMHAEKIKKQMEFDKMERERQFEEKKKIELKSSKELQKSDGTKTKLRVRKLNGELITFEVDRKSSLSSVRDILTKDYGCDLFLISINFPNYIFSLSEENKSMEELGLVPTAALFLVKNSTEKNTNATTNSEGTSYSPFSIISSVVSTAFTWGSWFIGYTPTPQSVEQKLDPFGPVGGKVYHIKTENEYNYYLNSKHLVVVDYSAPWCEPCKEIEPIVEQLAKSNTDVIFLHINVEELQIPDSSDVKYLPTFKFYKNKIFIKEIHGADETQLGEEIYKNKL